MSKRTFIPIPVPPIKIIERFFRNVCDIPTDRGCFLWLAGKSKAGYGKLRIGRDVVLAPRVAYRLAYGVDPESLDVCHKCDTPLCVNPAHLFLGTSLDNTWDAVSKGRMGCVHRSTVIYQPEE